MASCLAIVIGITTYESRTLSPLPAAEADARRMAQSLVGWGIPAQCVRLLLGPQATRRAVIEALRVWPLTFGCVPLRLIVYFAGHGTRILEDGVPPASALLLYDSNMSDRLGTGLSLTELIGAINRVKPRQAHIFLDACDLRLDRIENPIHDATSLTTIPDADVLQTARAGCLFCMVAAGPQKAYEDSATRSGYFTTSLLSALSSLRAKRSSCTDLAREVDRQLSATGIQKPEVYHIGDAGAWPLPDNTAQDILDNRTEDASVPRLETVAALQDCISSTHASIWIWGESGSGKTTLIKQMMLDRSAAVYYSIAQPKETTFEIIYDSIASAIAEQLSDLFPNGRPLIGGSHVTLEFVADRSHGTLLIIDHIDHLSQANAESLLTALGRIPTIRVIYISRYPPSATAKNASHELATWRVPVLSVVETNLFLEMYCSKKLGTASFFFALAGGNPLRLRQLLVEFEMNESSNNAAVFPEELRSAANAVLICRGYINDSLFRSVFDVTTDHLTALERRGFIMVSDGCFVPHDSLAEALDFPDLSNLANSAIRYWALEVEHHAGNHWAAQRLLDAVSRHGWVREADLPLASAIASLAYQREWESIVQIVPILREVTEQCLGRVAAAEELVRASRFDEACKLTVASLNLRASDLEYLRAAVIESERLWWCGDFENSKKLANVCNGAIELEPAMRHWATLNIGIAAFFEGAWELASKSFRAIIDASDALPRTIAWSRLMLGSTDGIRGINISFSRLLLESSIRMLESLGDGVGLTIGWTNIGEMSWKLGDLRVSLLQLKRARELALRIQHIPMTLESTRNLLQVHLRYYGPFHYATDDIYRAVQDLVRGEIAGMESIQVWNTLATVAAYRGDISGLELALLHAMPATEGNKEYHMYSLANRALLRAFRKEEDGAIDDLRDALSLAVAGQNTLAVKQIRGDIESIQTYVNPNTINALISVLDSELIRADNESAR